MKRYHLLLLSIASGLLLSISWPERGIAPFILIALVPLLTVENHIVENRFRFGRYSIFTYAYLSFFIWNLLTTWWIKNSTLFGATMAVFFNTLFMSIVFTIFHRIRQRLHGSALNLFSLVFIWTSFEFLHMKWDLSWSWLNLGNVFAFWPKWIQWYEFTGSLGGTIWILWVNILVFQASYKLFYHASAPLKNRFLAFVPAFLLVVIPLTYSFIRYYTYPLSEGKYEVVVVQPNIDPYEEKYGGIPYPEQMKIMLDLARKEVTPKTDFVVFPESAIQEGGLWENDTFKHSYSIDSVRRFIQSFPKLQVIIGASTYRQFQPGEKLTRAAREFSQEKGKYFSAHNAVLLINSTPEIQLYHKSQLVVGVEKMPFPKLLKFLEKFALDMGGTVGTIGSDSIRKVLHTPIDNIGVSSVICYESVYGEFCSEFVKNGAQLFFIITNDGWWGNTPGHRQHLGFAALRAIENRRDIARSANTGISAFVNQRGEILNATPYWEEAVVKAKLSANHHITFYTQYGDYLARISCLISVLLLLISLAKWMRQRSKFSLGQD